MIKRFSTLYVGHIELERCGLAGTPADDRRYPNARLAETFDTARAMAELVDRLGYDTLWLAEHHFSTYGYLSRPLTFALHLANKTKRLRIGTAVIVLPLTIGCQTSTGCTGRGTSVISFNRYPRYGTSGGIV